MTNIPVKSDDEHDEKPVTETGDTLHGASSPTESAHVHEQDQEETNQESDK